MPLAAGSHIGSYEVLALIGQGGMGEVYRARDKTLDRDVAIKRIPDSVSNDPERLARFEREAKSLAALNHPNVAQIYAVEAGTIVMELVSGEPLQGPVPLHEALDYAAQMASALGAAHDKGILHRDLKPSNIMVTPDGVIKVLDFGLAAREELQPESSPDQSPTLMTHATQMGMIIGTAAYMAPEQASGKPVDKRADIWAFGVVLWELVTGRRMFEGETVSHVLAAVLTQPPDLDAVPPRIRPLLARCLEKDPKKRLRDIGDAMSLVSNEAADSRTASTSPRTTRAQRVLATTGWLAAAALAVVAAVLAWSRPPAIDAIAQPIVRFQIARAIDIYNQGPTAFAVSPDGLSIAYYNQGPEGRLALYVRTLATGEVRAVPGAETFSPRAHSLFWSPDSRQLVRAMQTGAFVVDVVAGATRPLCDCRYTGGSWNRAGVILLGAAALGQGIRRVSVTDRNPIDITKPDAARAEQDRWPVFLPDGQRFLFTRTTAGADNVAYLATLDGGEPKRIGNGSWRVVMPAAGGRGTYLVGVEAVGIVAQAFDLDTLAARGNAETVAAAATAVSGSPNGVLATTVPGTRPKTVPTWFGRDGRRLGAVGEGGFIEGVALSPDGRKLAVAAADDGAVGQLHDIRVQDLGQAASTKLTFGPENDTAPVWSPDANLIAYATARDGVSQLYRRSADGTGNEVRLLTSDRSAFVNDWSLDGRWLIFSSQRTSTTRDNDLWFVPMSPSGIAGEPKPYIIAPERQQQAQFSPDGRFVAFGSEQSGSFEIYVQPFPDPMQGKWMVSNGGGFEPRWSRDGKELFYFSGQTLMAMPITLTPTFSSGTPVALFDAPIQAGYTNDTDRWQPAPDAKRFLLLTLAGQQQAPPLEVIVNWSPARPASRLSGNQ